MHNNLTEYLNRVKEELGDAWFAKANVNISAGTKIDAYAKMYAAQCFIDGKTITTCVNRLKKAFPIDDGVK